MAGRSLACKKWAEKRQDGIFIENAEGERLRDLKTRAKRLRHGDIRKNSDSVRWFIQMICWV